MKYQISIFLCLIHFLLGGTELTAVELISSKTIDEFKKSTEMFRLKNRIPVIFRTIPSSEIIQFNITFRYGSRDAVNMPKTTGSLVTALMTRASREYDKKKVFEITEKFSFNPICSVSFEQTTCAISTVADYWKDALSLLASLITEPTFEEEDVNLYKERILAQVKNATSDPETVSEDSAESLYWPPKHPYRITLKERLDEIPQVNRSMITDWHKAMMKSSGTFITVVGSIDKKVILKKLNEDFGGLDEKKSVRAGLPPVEYSKERSFEFIDRKTPTAFITIEHAAPAATDPDYTAFKLLTRILSEELWDAVRSKKSLSYGVYSTFSAWEQGIGTLSASTSKPKECLDEIRNVIYKVMDQEYTRTELEEQKTIYTTSYFLSQEEHSSIASSLSSSFFWFQNTNHSYEFPKRLQIVTPRDIKELARTYLRNFRIAVVHDKSKFQEKWARAFIDLFEDSKLDKRLRKKSKAI